MATGTSIVRHDPAARLAAFNRVSTDSVDAAADAMLRRCRAGWRARSSSSRRSISPPRAAGRFNRRFWISST